MVDRAAYYHSVGRYSPYASTEADVTAMPRTWAGDGSLAGVVYCHGRSGSAFDIAEPVGNRAGTYAIGHALGSRWPTVAADLGGTGTWGHPLTQQARIADAIAYLKRPRPVDPSDPPGVGCGPGKVALVGTSMGGLGALLFAMNRPNEVACVAGITPVVALTAVRNSGFATAEINTVWGVTPSGTTVVPLPAGADPFLRTADLVTPFECWYSDGDEIVDDADVVAFTAAVGGVANLAGSMLHSDVAAAVDPMDVVAFVATHIGAGAIP